MSLTVVLITGANSGVGYATSKVLVRSSECFHIIMTGRSLERCESAKAELESEGVKGSLSVMQLDVTDEKSVLKAAASVERQFGKLDVLVNNAGVGGFEPNMGMRFQICFQTNVMGPALVSEAFRPLLLKSQNPYSIFVGTGQRSLTRNAWQRPASHGNIQNGGAYQISKAALNMLAVLEARDHGPDGLKVFVMSPGFVQSNLRGSSHEERTGWGQAGDPDVSGGIVLDIVQGKRDGDVGSFVHKDGVYPW
ncbi:putative Short chain dehydrogenase/reductase [Seiridium cardinale]|uniref:Short chain dehydrogenase/reductase n=1 Tax=Seiridium cardinale TaxID=138064 RepID=A0ABR2XAC2_9PEZI